MVNLPWLDKETKKETFKKSYTPGPPPGQEGGPGFVAKPSTSQNITSAKGGYDQGWTEKNYLEASGQNKNNVNKNTKKDISVTWSENDDFDNNNINDYNWQNNQTKTNDYVGKNWTTTEDNFLHDQTYNGYNYNDDEGLIDIGSLPFNDNKTYNEVGKESDDLYEWWTGDKDAGSGSLASTLFGKSDINNLNLFDRELRDENGKKTGKIIQGIASTHSIAKKIHEANPEWTWYEVLNFMEGDYHDDGRVGVLGKHSDKSTGLALSIPNKRGDKHKSINPETWAILGLDGNNSTKRYNTFGAGLRSNWEMNIGELTNRSSYEDTLNLLAGNVDPSNTDLFQHQRALIDRVKTFNPSHGKGAISKIFLGFLSGFVGIPGMVATQIINSKSTAAGEREPLDQKYMETLVAPFTSFFEQEGIDKDGIKSIFSSSGGVIINNKTSLVDKYDLKQYHYDDVNSNADTPANKYSIYAPVEYTSEEAVSPESQYGTWIGTTGPWGGDHIDSDGDGIDDRWQSGPGEPSQQPGSEQGTSIASTNNPAWMDFGGGFERLFTAKEGGVVNKYQTGGFVRKPQMISDPTAAPASQRADDVNLQAETGDFIMGYPAMQKSGTRVRSLVEQAMLKAKDAGVKTKGYKKGDKVDILVHNGEMQIPQELVPYIGGGYATLKKLNAPSKHDEGDTVRKGFAEPAKPMPNIPDVFAEPAKPIKNNNIKPFPLQGGRTLSDEDFQNQMAQLNDAVMTVSPPRFGGVFYDKRNVRDLPSIKKHGLYSDQLWKKFLDKLIKSTPSNPTAQRETALKVKEAIEGSKISVNPKLLLNNEFIKNAYSSSEFHIIMNEVHKIMGKNDVEYKVQLLKDGLLFDYPKGTPALTGRDKPMTGYRDLLNPVNLNYTANEPMSSLAKQVIQEKLDNNTIDDFSTDMTGNTGQHSRQAYKASFPNEYGKLFKYLKDIEGIGGKHKENIYNDVGKPAIGYGHRLSSDELKAYNGMPGDRSVPNWTKEDSEMMLGKDILEAEHLARSIYNSKTGAKFSDLDDNRKMMLTEMAFNMGNKLKGFPKFMQAAKNKDYETMSSEYHRTAQDENGNKLKGIETRNKEFFRRFLSPYLFGGTEGTGGRL